MTQDKQLELAQWAEEVQLLPEGYEPIPGLVTRSTFAVAVGENPNARPGERYAVAAGRTAMLLGKVRPLPREPFTSEFPRRNIAEREYNRLVDELG